MRRIGRSMLEKSMQFRVIQGYNQLLVTNWLPFDIEVAFKISNPKQWVGHFRPDLNLTQNHNKPIILSSHSSVHSSQLIKPTLSPYMMANLGNFTLQVKSKQFGQASFPGSQVNAQGVSSYSLFFGLYQLRHRAGLKYNIYEIMGRGIIDNANWMKKLCQNRPGIKLNQIIIPGSHDSGMIINRFSFLKRLTQNQYDDIFGQLVAGIRYFDLRFTKKFGKYYIYHGNNYVAETGITLDSLIADVNSFLDFYGTEQTILFNVSRTRREAKTEDRKILAKKLMKDIKKAVMRSDLRAKNLAEEQLQNVKGKVLIMFDEREFKELKPGYLRINQLKGDNVDKFEKCEGMLNVYDHYSNTNVIEQMIADQNRKLKLFGGLSQKYLHLYSFTLTVQSKLRFSLQHYSIQLLGNISRSRLPIELHRMRTGSLPKPNIIFYDFIDSWSCSAIIRLNY